MGSRVASLACLLLFVLPAGGCMFDPMAGTAKDRVDEPAFMVPATKTGLVLDNLPPPRRKLDVSIYNFPDLTGQNKS
ncbi:MAG TPA: curli production assembly protein CsgG, partial [Bradyrhizobium sp.]|nr:curli production assembly protein CsgG [Bradyrhizobium sp.]